MSQTWKLEIRQEKYQQVMVVAFAGRLGADRSHGLADSLGDAIRGGQRRLLVDLEGVDYVSSAGLQALQTAAAGMRQSGGSLVLCALCEPVRLALELAGLTAEFAIEPTREAGLQRLQG